MLTCSLDGYIKVWDVEKLPKEVQSINVGKEIWDISLSKQGNEVIIGTDQGCEFYSLRK